MEELWQGRHGLLSARRSPVRLLTAQPAVRCRGLTTTLMSSFSRLVQSSYNLAHRLLNDPKCFSLLAALVVLGDAALTQLIIRFVPCQPVYPPALRPT